MSPTVRELQYTTTKGSMRGTESEREKLGDGTERQRERERER